MKQCDLCWQAHMSVHMTCILLGVETRDQEPCILVKMAATCNLTQVKRKYRTLMRSDSCFLTTESCSGPPMSQNNIAIQEVLPQHEVLEKLSLVAASLHALLYPMWGVVDSIHSCLMIVAWFSHSFIQQAMWFLYFMRYFHSLMMIVRPWWLRPCLPS